MTEIEPTSGGRPDPTAPQGGMPDDNIRARIRVNDAIRGQARRARIEAASPPVFLRHSPPQVTWHAQQCRRGRRQCRILRAYRRPAGWLVLGESFRVPPADWLQRVDSEFSVDDHRSGRVFFPGMRLVRGVDRNLPLDTDSWADGEFEAGCDHGFGRFPIGDLAEDCREAVRLASPVVRGLSWS